VLKFFFTPASRAVRESLYYAKDRWPLYDFKAKPPGEVTYQIARKSEAA
jgi:hypothetical protein